MVSLIRYATLALHGADTQRWRFRISANRGSILPDFTRRTPVFDRDDHHLFVNLGCAAETLLIVAGARGRAEAVYVEAAPETRIDIDLTPAAARETARCAAIAWRKSTRTVFDEQPASAQDLTRLEAAAREDGVSAKILSAENDPESVLDDVVQGNGTQMVDPAFVAERRGWISFSPEQALSPNDGLFAACSCNRVHPA